MTGVIRTIGGDLPAELAGPTYVHEHLIIDSPLVADTMPHIHLHSVDEAVAELQTCVAAGIRTMVDAMPAASGRDPERLSQISVLSGVRIVASTGLHTARYYPDVPWTGLETPEQLAERFVADIEVGIDQHDYRGETVVRTVMRAGLVKVAAIGERLTAREERLFEAAALTAARTGAPVLTHTEGGRGGLAQIGRLVDLGVPPERVALSHTDKVADKRYHEDMLAAGVFLCYDQGLRQPEATIDIIEAMIAAGHDDRILLGTDGARRSLWTTLGGGPGLASLYPVVIDAFGAGIAEKLFVHNPARLLSLNR